MDKKEYPHRLKRSQSFFGLHFDFHATDEYEGIGATVTEEMIGQIIDAAQPDFLQCDCKGHPGFSSYPTKVGNAAPGIAQDALRVWREVTARHGVSLYMHYSGVWDTEAIRCHPSWARVDETGKADANITSVFGPYADELLIPQLKELSNEYDVDGVWVDGDCWATNADYGAAVLKAFRAQTGIAGASTGPGGEHFLDFLTFCRKGFQSYLKHYAGELHRSCPGFEVASNWAYTSFMPEPVETPVDFCSGDLSPQNAVNAARFEARCLAHQGRPWDLMSWGFSSRFPDDRSFCLKSAVQLSQEAAVVLSQGGAYQSYFTQKADGSVRLWQLGMISELARFVRERQPFCQHAQPVPQVALLLSATELYAELARPFDSSSFTTSKTKSSLAGILQCLLDSQITVDILMEHTLEQSMNEYPLVVVPECVKMKEGLKDKLVEYARGGGSLLVIGAAAAGKFAQELDVTYPAEPEQADVIYLSLSGAFNSIRTAHAAVQLGEDGEEFGRLYGEDDFSGGHCPAASITNLDKGKIAGVYFDAGERYLHAGTPAIRDFFGSLVKQLFPEPVVEVTGSHYVDVGVNRLDGALAVNLINTAGPHADANVYVYDGIPPVGPLQISIRTGQKPEAVLLEPGDTTLPFTFENGVARLTLEKLEIHSVLLVK